MPFGGFFVLTLSKVTLDISPTKIKNKSLDHTKYGVENSNPTQDIVFERNQDLLQRFQ